MMGMDPVPIKVAGEIEIPVGALPQMTLERIKSLLTISNEEREKAASLDQFGWWDMPEVVALYRVESRRGGDHVLCLPRGFASTLLWVLGQEGVPFQLDDQRSLAPAAEGYYRPFEVRDYQFDWVRRIIEVQQGIWKAPAGAGKTVGSLAAIAWTGQRALVILNKTSLANQWRLRAHQFLGFPIEQDEQGRDVAVLIKGAPSDTREAGFIGGGVWEEREFTVALRQTLHERSWQLDATGWWRTWGFTKWDEVHGVAADTSAELSRRITSFYIGGVSATPFKTPARAALVGALVGPIIHETPRDVLYEARVLTKPDVEVRPGSLRVVFWPDHEAEQKADGTWECQVPTCRKKGKHKHRNNYSSVLKSFVEDDARNARIARRIIADRGHTHLVSSGQKKHLNLIRRAVIKAGWPDDKIWVLTGDENAEGRDQEIIQEVMASDEAVLLSTIQVSGEGLDVPPIDRVHVVWAMRDEGMTIQLAGRGERVWDGKDGCVIVDYREPEADVFDGQFAERERVYRMQGYDVAEVLDDR
jgi:superfamily II DNA or RNA helicase